MKTVEILLLNISWYSENKTIVGVPSELGKELRVGWWAVTDKKTEGEESLTPIVGVAQSILIC